jgi:hypothetical protein
MVEAETLRSASQSSESSPPAKGEERLSIFWRVFGGTLLSIAALVILTVCQYFNSSLNELRNDLGRINDEIRKDMTHLNTDLRKDLGHVNEFHANVVKMDEFNGRMKSVWDSIKNLQDDKESVVVLREKAAMLVEMFKTGELERKELAREVQRLREVKAVADDRQELLREVQSLRERLAALEGTKQSAAAVIKATATTHREQP